MKQIFIIKNSRQVDHILNSSYDYFLTALKAKNPKAESLIEDESLAQAHDVYALIELGHLKIGQVEDDDSIYMTLEIK